MEGKNERHNICKLWRCNGINIGEDDFVSIEDTMTIQNKTMSTMDREKNETPVSQKMFKVIQEKNQQSIWVQIALGCFYCVAQIGNKCYI